MTADHERCNLRSKPARRGGLAHGGAITNTNAATVNIKHATISLNSAQAGNTGVNQSELNRRRFAAEGTGGGIPLVPGSVTLENTIITGNTAANGLGDNTGAPIPAQCGRYRHQQRR